MEASTIPATAGLTSASRRGRVVGGPLLRLRSDEQLVRLFRTGSEEAFRVIHDRYRARLFAYARQMLGGSRADAEDALQDVFVRAYGALRANDRDVSLRAWLYRIAHNRCIDELRRAGGGGATGADAPAEALERLQAPASDPMDAVAQRESLRRLVQDVQRLPEQQRSALLMREISGMAYQDLAAALDVTVPAVKSLLVRARVGLAQAAEARDTACAAIRADLADAHERGVRANGLVRRHLHDCDGCRAYKRELRVLDRRLAALVPAVGPVALLAKLLGGGAGAGAAAGGGAGATTGGAGAAGAAAASAAGAGAAGVGVGHIAAAVAVAVVSAGGAVEVHHTLIRQPHATRMHHASAASVQSAPTAAASTGHTGAGASEAARRADAARRLRLRIAPATGAGRPVTIEAPDPTAPPVTTLDPAATGPGNGGVTAPVDPAAAPVDPAVPTPAEPAPADGGEGPVVGATIGTAGPTPPAGGTTAPAPPPPGSGPAAPPATSAAPPPTPGPAPTPATTGGATYQPRR